MHLNRPNYSDECITTTTFLGPTPARKMPSRDSFGDMHNIVTRNPPI